MARVVIVAESTVVRAGLEALLAGDATLTVIGRARELTDLAPLIAASQPNVVLWEVDAGPVDIVNTLLDLSPERPLPALVLLAPRETIASLAPLWRLGVHALLPRTATAEAILAGVAAVTAGLVVWHPDALAAPHPLLPLGELDSAVLTVEALTPRETEVLGMLAEGWSNKAIARQLQLSEHTVKFHLASIFTKLGATSRTEAVTLGLRRGLIML